MSILSVPIPVEITDNFTPLYKPVTVENYLFLILKSIWSKNVETNSTLAGSPTKITLFDTFSGKRHK